MAVPYLGDYAEDQTVFVAFNTFSSDDPSASVTITNLADTDIHIHKDDGTTQHSDAADVDVQIDFDTITGNHLVEIRTTAAFFTTGADYFVRMEGTTVDAGTINAWIGHFSIENRFTNVSKISGSSTAADNAEVVFDTDFATNYDTTNNYWVSLLANDANHGGAAFVLTGDRLAFTSTSGACASFTGEGAGHGISATGGSGSGSGIAATGASNGHGAIFTGAGTGNGFTCLATGNASGIKAEGSTQGAGMYCLGGGTDGDGFWARGGAAGNGHGASFWAAGTGKALADGSNNYVGVDTQALNADETAAANAEAAFDGTGYNVGNGSIVAASVTGNVGGNVVGSIGSLGATAQANVNSEVVDALATDTYAERGAGAGPPSATATLADKIGWLAMLARNEMTNDGSTQTLKTDAGTSCSTASVSDAAGTTTRGEWT